MVQDSGLNANMVISSLTAFISTITRGGVWPVPNGGVRGLITVSGVHQLFATGSGGEDTRVHGQLVTSSRLPANSRT